MYALTNATLFTSAAELLGHALIIEGDRMIDVVAQATLPEYIPAIDLKDCIVAPGFIDLQLNGCGGVMFNDAITADTLDTMHRTNLRSGTTSFLPTLITAPDEDMLAAMQLVTAYRQHSLHNILGLHLEGPYLNPRRKGIHNGNYVRQPEAAMLQKIAHAGRDTVKLLTLAPEMAQPDDIRLLADAGIVVSAGHTDADYETAIASFEAGVSMATHLFNAMSPWQGRSPGMVGAVLNDENVYAGIIADGHHVHLASVGLAHKIKRDRLILVTDATPAAGANIASFRIGGQEVFCQAGKCVSADGTLGGSALTMIEAIRNCVEMIGIPLEEVLRMASFYPAQAIAVDDELGRIVPGYIANLVVLNADLAVVGVVDRGTWHSFVAES